MNRTAITIEKIGWERINVVLRGRLDTVHHPAELSFYLSSDSELTGERRAPIDKVTVHEGRITLRLNVMAALDQFPLESGDWRLLMTTPDDDDPIPASMDAGFRLDPCGYGGLFAARGGPYWVVPGCTTNGGFLLVVNSRGTLQPVGRRVPPLSVRIRRLPKSLRDSVYVGLYRLFTTLARRNGRRVLFTSDSRERLSGNLLAIHDRMVSRGLDSDYALLSSFKPSIKAKRGFVDKIRFTYYLAIADVILLDDYQPMIYKVPFPDSVKLIQVWHASGAFKTVGYSRVGKPGGPGPFSNQHKNYTHAIVSSVHDVPFYAEAFGIPESRVAPTGIPRMDVFFDEEYKARARERVYASLPDARGHETILFAPTFRGAGPGDAYYDNDLIDFDALYRLCEERDSVVIFKMHPFVLDPPVIPERYTDRFIDATHEREINEILLICDLVITDYSSLVFEYSVLNRPMLFFAYDLEEYVATRDFYEDFDEFVPGRIVRTFSELITAIEEQEFEVEKVSEFAHRHFSHLDGGSTDRVIDQLVLGSRDSE